MFYACIKKKTIQVPNTVSILYIPIESNKSLKKVSVPKYLNGKVNEATYVKGVFHEVKDELDVLDQGKVIGHP